MTEELQSVRASHAAASFTIENGKSYLFRYKHDPKRKNAKLREMRAQILMIEVEEFPGPDGVRRVKLMTNHRPWGEGGSGYIYLDQIEESYPIPRGPHDR